MKTTRHILATHLNSRRTPLRTAGRSLVELMIVLLISAVVLGAVLSTMVSTGQSGRRIDSAGRLLESGELGLQVLARDLRMAGYGTPRIYAVNATTPGRNVSLTGIRGCDGNFTNGRGNGAVASLEQLQCDNAGASDSFSVTYEADQFNANMTNAGVPSDCTGTGLVATPGSNPVGNAWTQASPGVITTNGWYWRVENRYYIANTGDGESALFCAGNGGAPGFSQGVALVRGVSRMTVTYGTGNGSLLNDGPGNYISMAADTVQYMTANQIDNNAAWVAEGTDTRWQRVISAQVCLEMVGERGSADTGASFINCDNVNTNIADGRMRRAVRMQVNLRNRTVAPPTNITY